MRDQGVRFWSKYTRTYLYEPDKKASLATLLIVIYIVLVSVFLLKPLFKNIEKQKADIAERKLAVSTYNDRKAKINELMPLYSKAQPLHDDLKKLLPETEDIPGLLEELTYIASKNGMEMTFIAPLTEPAHPTRTEKFKVINVLARFEGNINNSKAFVRDLEAAVRFVGIKSVVLNSREIDGRGEAILQFTIYSLEP